ncbi:DUF6708 domain-containing protein [Pseudoduganella albidiflava]|uniref:DUF6708 domain-containing protein n=1 Tax=Pseudoduganella albidiflava TaxID=321983 RepID=A0A411X6Y7_9BURK|nr:DUF6708 domain-containing protein [Pseudoduganella albidiflava]QBI04674.1 hypothetical protein EYF70_30490 [Pseudoduganella albidiflava]GGY29143.1 hypothetical protein GCM10007387_09230 [Pseudoduganella albidiflava]
MDDRIFSAKLGKPIPEWDNAHRLPISGWVGPDCKDSATIFQINSTFMEVTEQSHMIRQWFAGGIVVAVLMTTGMAMLMVGALRIVSEKGWPIGGLFSLMIPILGFLGFGAIACHFGCKEFFARKIYPLRFNRRTKKVYALVRALSDNASNNESNFMEEIEWSDQSVFCIHRADQDGVHYWIRYYKVDASGLVQKVVAIGRDWEGDDGIEELIAQWNYWCWYMSRGPADLPKPCLYLAKDEKLRESFLYCLYEMGFQESVTFRVAAMPVVLMLTFFRAFAIFTCVLPKWPAYVEENCRVDPDDPFDEPRAGTPVGWYATNLAIFAGAYPAGDQKKIDDWIGETDGKRNAQQWAEDKFIAHIRSESRNMMSDGEET